MTAVVSTELFGVSVLVSYNDCDKQPSYEYCREGTKWFQDHCKTAHHYSVLALIWLWSVQTKNVLCKRSKNQSKTSVSGLIAVPA